MFSALEACDFNKIRNYFEYIEIDDESRKVLDEYGIKNINTGNIPEKWCVNVDRQIAFLELRYVPSMDQDECHREYLVAVHDGYGTFSFSHDEYVPGKFSFPRVNWKEGWDHSKLTVPVLLTLVEEVMKVREMDWLIDNRYQSTMRKAERLKRTQVEILYGVFPPILQEMLNSITELADVELRFRRACMKHFVEWNMQKKRNYGFYLHDDEDSFFLFDFLLWAYLHISSSMEQLKQDWDNIVNEKYQYTSSEINHFCIGGAKEFFFEKYMDKRTEEGRILLFGDEIRFAWGYPESILNRFK